MLQFSGLEIFDPGRRHLIKQGSCFIGTSGWSYTDWAKGRFYPSGLKQRDWLGFFAKHFQTVEVNASFYHVPRPEFISRWCGVTDSKFLFSVKLWRRISHYKKLAGCTEDIEYFLDTIKGFGRKRGALLVQLPPSMQVDLDLLNTFLDDLRKAMRRLRWRIVVEFRNKDWLCKPVFDVLTQRGAAICLSDMPRCLVDEPNDVGFVYVRRHGPRGRYRGCYSPGHISSDARLIRKWLSRGKDIFVYYNNDINGHAVDNARDLINEIKR